MKGPSDQTPEDDALQGDRPIGAELLGQLLDEHGPALALYASQWTDAADDCVQEALVELARQPSRPENLRAWLFRVVKHRALNAARGARRRRDREDQAVKSRLTESRSTSVDRLDAIVISEALDNLDPIEREVLVLRIWGGLTFSEIAVSLKRSTTSVHRYYQQALQSLRKNLEPPCTTSSNQTTSRFPRN